MNLDDRVYIAGHRGLVGSAILRRLQKAGYSRLITRDHAELDLCDQAAVEAFFAHERPEYVFLAAARVGGIFANDAYPADFIRDNLLVQTLAIDAAWRHGARKLLFLGSSCIYPKLAPQPLKEEYLLTGTLEPTNEPYAIAKIAAIKLCRYYNEQYGTNFLSVMPTNLFGPGDNFNLEMSHVLPALIRKFHLAKLLRLGRIDDVRADLGKRTLGFGLQLRAQAGAPDVEALLKRIGVSAQAVELWGTGSPMREFLHVDDLADAVLFLMQRYDYNQVGEFVNIGTGKDLSIKDLAERIRSIVGFSGEIRFDSSKPDGTPRKLLDVSRLNGLGWTPKISLDEGIRLTYQWYLSQ